MNYKSPAIEADVVANARTKGLALFRVIVLRFDEYLRLTHYLHADRELARSMASDLARLHGPREAIVEEIDSASGLVISAFKPGA